MHRLFVGLRLPPAMRGELHPLMGGIDGARWQDDEQLHVTLRFIGGVDRHAAEDVAAALGAVAAPPLDLRLAGVGSFDARGHPNAVWAGVRPRDAIGALHRKIDHAIVRTGLPPEGRAYLPHVTVARMGRGAAGVDAYLAAHAGFAGAVHRITHFTLYESHMGHGGSRYEAIARYPLDQDER